MTFYIGRFKGLETMEFEAEIITPMFLGGSDTKKAEFRVPSIKGALRFWWRAANAHLSMDKLKERESEIFGDAGSQFGKSKVQIKLIQTIEYNGKIKANPVPHKKATFSFPCLMPGEIFVVKIIGNKTVFDLFRLFSVLSGLGKRSRRGFGSFLINKENGIPCNKLN